MARVRVLNLEAPFETELVDALVHSDSLGSMRELCLSGPWNVDTNAIRSLARWTGLARLESLTFVLFGLEDEQLEILAESPWLADLKKFCLSETKVTDEGVERFCRTPVWSGLEELAIDRNELTERSGRAILAANWFPRLKLLDLHASRGIGDAVAAALASYQGPTRLRTLLLSRAGVSDAGALALAEAAFAPQLWTLWLWGSHFSPSVSDLLNKRFGSRVNTVP